MSTEDIENIKLPLRTRLKKRFELALGKKKQILGMFIVGIIISVIISLSLTKYYRANSKIFFNYNSIQSRFLESQGSLDSEVNQFYQPQFTQNVLNNLSEKGYSLSRAEFSQAKEVKAEFEPPAISIQIVSEDPELASEIANTLVDEYFYTSLLNSKLFLINALKIISERENSLQEDINNDLSEQQSSLISSLTLGQENLITQISEFESELENLELENQIFNFELQRLVEVIENSFPESSKELFFINNSKIDSLIEKLDRLETVKNLSNISQKLGGFNIQYLWPENYSLSELSQIREDFFTELNNYIDLEYGTEYKDQKIFLKSLVDKYYDVSITLSSIDLAKSTIFNNLTSLEQGFNRIPFGLINEARDSRLKKFNNSLLLKLKTQKSELLSDQENYLADIDYVNKAEIPDSYFSPSFTLNIFLGSLIGLLAGILFAFSLNSERIEIIESSFDLSEYDFKVLAKIPNIPAGSPILFDTHKKNQQNKIYSDITQSFSSIGTFLKYGSLDKPLKSILITSGQSGEGKSIIASNLAIALADSGNKVLLVDINLKYPVLHKFFKVKSTPSLAHFLFRKKELSDIIRKTHLENLDLITCIEFPHNPSVIIASKRVKNFMDQLKSKYDYIVYDSASIDNLKETIELSIYMDEIMLVVRSGKTKLSELFSLQKMLNEKSVLEFDIVLNDVKESNS